MRYLLPVLLILAAIWYFTTGIRVGVVTFTPTYMANANGSASYRIRAFDERQQVGYSGGCQVRSGQAVIQFFNPAGNLAAQPIQCVSGNWSINVLGSGAPGFYKAVVNYKNFTGKITLNEVVQAGRR